MWNFTSSGVSHMVQTPAGVLHQTFMAESKDSLACVAEDGEGECQGYVWYQSQPDYFMNLVT